METSRPSDPLSWRSFRERFGSPGGASTRLGAVMKTLVALLLLAAVPAQAQEIRVRVKEPGRPNMAVGVLVSLRNPTGAIVATGVTNDVGRVRLMAPAGIYQLVVERPGFADTTETVTVGLALDSITISHAARRPALAARLLTVPARCTEGGTVPAEAAGLWAEASKALRTVAVTEDAQAATFSLAAFQRSLSPTLKKDDEQLNTLLGGSNRPPNATPAAVLATEGYLTGQGSSVWRAPDVAVLSSPEFVQTHCFGVVTGVLGREGYTGLRFVPVISSRVDIEGTMWIDPASRELKVVDYGFAGVSPSWHPDRFGGSLEFHRSEIGFWITRFWYQRVPRLDAARLRGYSEDGAEVMGITATIDTTDRIAVTRAIIKQEMEVRRRVAKLTGTVVDTLGYPVGDAEVSILGTEYQASSTRNGTFAIDGLPVGMQIVRVRKVGYKVQYFSIRLAGGQEWDGKVAIRKLPQSLGEVTVVGKYGKPPQYANTSKYDDFYRRRSKRVGRFLNREEIDQRAAGKIAELLQSMPGVRIGFTAPLQSEEISFLNCTASGVGVWIDGQKMTGDVGEILPLITPSDIEAIEVYQRQILVPPEYRDNSCAAIVMWTR